MHEIQAGVLRDQKKSNAFFFVRPNEHPLSDGAGEQRPGKTADGDGLLLGYVLQNHVSPLGAPGHFQHQSAGITIGFIVQRLIAEGLGSYKAQPVAIGHPGRAIALQAHIFLGGGGEGDLRIIGGGGIGLHGFVGALPVPLGTQLDLRVYRVGGDAQQTDEGGRNEKITKLSLLFHRNILLLMGVRHGKIPIINAAKGLVKVFSVHAPKPSFSKNAFSSARSFFSRYFT